MSSKPFTTGIENFLNLPLSERQAYGRLGLVSNQASVDMHLQPSWKLLYDTLPKQLTTLFGPQHGFESTVQDNMIESGHGTHSPTGLKVYSLYSETREPTPAMLSDVDTIIIDLQHSGTRVYTYKYTMAACLRAARKLSKKVLVLDRPNPLGGVRVGGRVLQAGSESFVGEFPIPMQHGLTMGELALYFNNTLKADVEIVAMKNWRPDLMWHEYQRPWVLTSPNVPIPESLYTFPGTVMLEATNISEGRGTCLPFLFIGAPYLKSAEEFSQTVRRILNNDSAVYLRPTQFMPSFQKWANQSCNGFQIHILDPYKLDAYKLGIAIIQAVRALSREFSWQEPGYEYNFKDLPIDLILGAQNISSKIDTPIHELFWQEGVGSFMDSAKEFLLYEREMKN